jgi:hypothetical protein
MTDTSVAGDEARHSNDSTPTAGTAPWWIGALLAVLVVQFLALGLIQAHQDSFTFDEPFYAVSGSTALRERDLRINFEHPPLPKVLAALPAELLGDVVIPMESGSWDAGDTWNLSLETVQANSDQIRTVTFLYRIVPLIEAALVALLLYLLGRELFDWRAGAFSAAMWLTLPVVLGFGHLNGLDIPATLTVVLTAWLLARYVDRQSMARLGLVAMSVGLALLTRAAVGLVVLGSACLVVLLVGLFARDRWVPARVVAVAFVGWSMVWIGYWALDPSGLDVAVFGAGTQALLTAPPTSLPGRLALAVPWPAGFEAGIRYLSDFHSTAESPGYLLGRNFTGAPPWFWLGSLVMKLTIVSMLSMIAGIIALALSGRRTSRAWVVLAPLILGLVTMMAFAQRPFGVRYLLPLIALGVAIAGAAVALLPFRRVAVVAAIVIGIQVLMLWESHPHSLAWSNPALRPAWQLAADSNVDWGQDFYRLEEWAEDKEAVYVSYFGFGPSWTLDEIPTAISAHPNGIFSGGARFPPRRPQYVAISASNLNAFAAGQFGFLRSVCPVERIGSTILVYRFEQMPPTLLGTHEGMPVGLCSDSEFSHSPEE